ncbi:HigA family addiction module antitoxin [Dyella japonica]|uniref:HigA family addiction module antitoxin n=1 Tax=Dyella japonica TaxID=231455 RepID=UPI00062D14AA|nr:HigA family addiction module antitoxin [Dyella japonica]
MCLTQLDPRLDVDPDTPLRRPGDVLLHDYMLPRDLSAAQLGRRTGVRASHLKGITLGTRRITPEIALRLACALEPTAFYWMALQWRFDLEKTQQQLTSRRASPKRASE